jgi:hypothetical protein
MPETTLTPKSVRTTEDEAKWLSAAATKGGVTQNDLLRLALHRLRKALGAASRIKPETVLATAKASKLQAHPASRGGRQSDLGLQGAVRRVREREGDAGETCPAYSRYASSRQPSASSRAGLRRSRKRCARPGEGACSARQFTCRRSARSPIATYWPHRSSAPRLTRAPSTRASRPCRSSCLPARTATASPTPALLIAMQARLLRKPAWVSRA